MCPAGLMMLAYVYHKQSCLFIVAITTKTGLFCTSAYGTAAYVHVFRATQVVDKVCLSSMHV